MGYTFLETLSVEHAVLPASEADIYEFKGIPAIWTGIMNGTHALSSRHCLLRTVEHVVLPARHLY